MKSFLLLIFLLSSHWALAEEVKTPTADDWNDSVLTEAVIKNIQAGQYTYKKCVMDEMRKPEIAKIESRHATDAVIKTCEAVLSKVRSTYTDAGVPGVIADRQLKSLRIKVTRNVLQELMYAEAAKAANPQVSPALAR